MTQVKENAVTPDYSAMPDEYGAEFSRQKH